MAKYKVGDVVRVKQTLDYGAGGLGFLDTMEHRCGTAVTISKVFEADFHLFDEPTYYLKEEDDGIQYYWCESWLEPLEGEDRMKIYGPQP